MKRRDFIAGAVAAGSLAACGQQGSQTATEGAAAEQKTHRWKMVTAWPRNYPGLGTAANNVAQAITEMSGGRIQVEVFGAGDLVPAFEVFDTVASGTAQLGHSAAYYWKGKHPTMQIFGAVPFGMNVQQTTSWLYHGGGLEYWQRLYEPFGLTVFPAGSTGVQMGGWFNKEINSIDDLRGLKMRIPGLGAEVLKRVGVVAVNMHGGEIFTALESGAIDATEWVGPYNDQAFGLFRAARYYYAPGWQEPGSILECMVNKQAFDALPDDLQAIVRHACRSVHDSTQAEFIANNARALKSLIEEHGVELRYFSDDIMDELERVSSQVLDQAVASDALSAEILKSYKDFRDATRQSLSTSEGAYYRHAFPERYGS